MLERSKKNYIAAIEEFMPQGWTLQQVADLFGATRERMRQIKKEFSLCVNIPVGAHARSLERKRGLSNKQH